MLLGVHLIVRDEASVLAGCLDSIGDWADELVVVDTGSADATRQIALSYGARVLDTVWTDDFAAARNIGIGQARTLWVLVIDADERLAADADMYALRDMLMASQLNAYRVVIESAVGGGGVPGRLIRHEAVRLFRADRGIRYEGAIHEQLVQAAANGGLKDVDGPLSGLRLMHSGYEQDQLARKQTVERNGRIIRRLIAEQPDNSYYWYHMGVTLCQQSKAAEASAAFARARQLSAPDAPFRPSLMLDSARALAAAGEEEQALKLLEGETERYDDYPDLLLLYGRLLEKHGDWLEARQAYRSAVDAGEKDAGNHYLTEAGAGSYEARTALGSLERRMGNRRAAAMLYEQALTEMPGWPEALAGMAELLHELGGADADIAQRVIRYAGAGEEIRPASTGGVRNTRLSAAAAALTGIGAYSSALPLWRDLSAAAGPLSSDHPDGPASFAVCLIRTGQYAEAAAMLQRQGEARGTLALESAMDWAICCWMEGRRLPMEADSWLDANTGPICRMAERWLLGHTGGDASGDDEAGFSLTAMIDRAVSHGLLRLAVRLSPRSGDVFAVSLHRHGYTAAAADRLLRLMGTGELTASGLCALGEMLYDRMLYNEALSLYERASLYAPDDVKARLGAAAASLRLASQALQEREQDRSAAQWMAEDRKRLDRAALRLEGLGWRTVRSGAQRRRMRSGGAAEADFLMHDREE